MRGVIMTETKENASKELTLDGLIELLEFPCFVSRDLEQRLKAMKILETDLTQFELMQMRKEILDSVNIDLLNFMVEHAKRRITQMLTIKEEWLSNGGAK